MYSNWSYSPETPNLGQIHRFLELCDLEIWRMTLKFNNRAPLLSNIKLCASFHHDIWIQAGVTVRKRLSWLLISVTLTFDPDLDLLQTCQVLKIVWCSTFRGEARWRAAVWYLHRRAGFFVLFGKCLLKKGVFFMFYIKHQKEQWCNLMLNYEQHRSHIIQV